MVPGSWLGMIGVKAGPTRETQNLISRKKTNESPPTLFRQAPVYPHDTDLPKKRTGRGWFLQNQTYLNKLRKNNMTLHLETDLEQALKDYPQIVERLPIFLREQINLEKWRASRFKIEDRDFAISIIEESSQSPANREESARQLKEAADEINAQLNSDNG